MGNSNQNQVFIKEKERSGFDNKTWNSLLAFYLPQISYTCGKQRSTLDYRHYITQMNIPMTAIIC